MACGSAGRRRRSAREGAPAVDTAMLDDYYGGRCDRRGAELVLTTSPRKSAMPGAVDASPTRPMHELTQILRQSQPELVWLIDDGCPLEHFAALVGLIRHAGSEILRIEHDPDIRVTT